MVVDVIKIFSNRLPMWTYCSNW